MVIRRSGQRRRRVVIDEVVNNRDEKNTDVRLKTSSTAETTIKKNKASEDSRLYSFGADRRGQRKTTDFVPKRFLSFACVVLVLIASIAALNLLATYSFAWESWVGNEGLQMMSITGVGSLSSWFSSFLLIITGLASLQVYALRQHRCDDYRGNYRLWIWMALLFLMASVNCVVGLESVLGNVVHAIFRQPTGDQTWILVTFKMVALALLVIRGLFEVKASRGAFAMVVIVWLAYTSATVIQISPVKNSVVVDHQTVYGNLILFANSMLLLSILTYARFVFMQANGLIKAHVPRLDSFSKTPKQSSMVSPRANDSGNKNTGSTIETRKPQRVVAQSTETSTKTKSRPPVPLPTRKDMPPVPAPSKKTSSSTSTSQPTTDEDTQAILSISHENNAKLSKAERRRQRKLEKRQQRAA